MNKIIKYLSLAVLFLFPFQTRLIYEPVYLNGQYFEWFSLSLSGIEILIWAVVVLTFFRLITNKTFWQEINKTRDKKDRLMKIIRPTLFLIFLAIYLLVAPLNRGLAEYKIFLLLGATCFALTLLINKINFKQALYALWGGGVLQALIGIVQFIAQRTWETKWLGWALHQQSDLGAAVMQAGGSERWLRAYGSFGWPNDLGIYLSVVFIFGLWLYQKTQNEKEKIILLAGQMLIIAGLFFSFSRGAIISLVIGLAVMFIFEKRKIFKPLVYPVVLLAILSIIYLPLLQSRVAMQNHLEIRAVSERITQYQEFANIFSGSPIFGVGPGNYVYALFSQNSTLAPWLYQPVHNVYLLFLAEWGIVGLLMGLLLAFYFFREVGKNNKTMLALWAVVLTAFLFDHYFYTSYSGIVFLAIIISLSLAKKEYE